MDTTPQDTLFSLTGIKLSIRCMSAFRKSCLPDSLKAESKCKIPNFILQSPPLCLCVLLEGKKEIRTARRLFCADAGAVRTAGS